MGRKQLNHVQYKRNIHPDFVDKMDKHLNKLKETEPIKSEQLKYAEWLREECYDTGSHWLYKKEDEIYTYLEIFEVFKRDNYEI